MTSPTRRRARHRAAMIALVVAASTAVGPAWADAADSPPAGAFPGTVSAGTNAAAAGESTSTTITGASSTATTILSTTAPTTSTASTLPTSIPPLVAAPTTTQPAVLQPLASTTGIIGSGSSFAGPEVLQWTADTAKSPYNLTVDYTSTSSGDGRFNFGNDTVDFAVSDIPYQSEAFDTKQPTFPFIYVPVTAGGLAFMYHLDGLSKTLQLSSYSACAIMTGAVTQWNDPVIVADNPGVSLPNLLIHPVIRSDLAGTNFVLQEYCIHEQPALWRAFVTSPDVVHAPGQVGDLSPTDPRSDWPIFRTATLESGSSQAADVVAQPNDDGYITAVETAYALQLGFPVASVKNASGVYNQPGSVNVASALAYATQNANGTHNLDFDGTGPHVYNPSTYSYLLTPTTGWSSAKGSSMSQFANYALTLGQQKATKIGYASLGLSLEQYGVNSIKAQVPGAVALTAAEQGGYACGDLTVPEVQAGQTQPTCGVLNTNDSNTPGQAATGGSSSTTSPTRSRSTATTSPTRSTSRSPGAGSSGSSVDPGVSLSSSPALPTTGGVPLPVVALGAGLATIGWLARRRLRPRIDEHR